MKIRNIIRVLKEQKIKEKCEETDALQMKHDSLYVHREIKQLTGVHKSRRVQKLVNGQGKVIIEKNEIKNA